MSEAGQQPAENSQPDAGSDKTQIAFIPDTAASVAIGTEVHAEREQQRADADLQAQQDMAFYALLMVVATVATVIITGVGVWFVKRTLDATLQAVKDTGEATQAMLEANRIAKDANRAWLTLDLQHGFTNSQTDGDRLLFFADLTISNIGRMPALGVAVEAIPIDDVDSYEDPKALFNLSEKKACPRSRDQGFVILPGVTQPEQLVFSAPIDIYGFGKAARVDVLIVADYLLASGEPAQTSARFVFFNGAHRGPVPVPEDGDDGGEGISVQSECLGYVRVV